MRPALVILLLPVVVFAGALLPGKVLSPADNLLTLIPWRAVAEVRPANPLANDVTFMFHPWLIYTGREIAAGRFPLWNPYGFAGAPFFANPQTAVLFPLNWLAWILPAAPAVTAIALLKLSLAGLGTYWLLRLLAVGRAAATVGAVSFMWSGVLGVWLPWSYGSVIACLPLVLAVTEYLRQHPGAPAVAWLGLVVAVTVFAGYPQGAAQALLAAGLWAVTRARSAGRPARFLGLVGGGLALGLALAAVQILPSLEYLRLSAVFPHRAQWFPLLTLPLRSAVTFLMPYYYGGPGAPDFWGYWNFNEITVSVGLVPWLALPLALLAGWRRPGARFFVGMAALAGAMLYGLPVLAPLLARLPPFSFTVNHRLAPFLTLGLCLLAALGLDAAARAPEPRRRLLARTVRIAFVALAAGGLLSLADDLSAALHHPMRMPLAWQYAAFLVLLTVAALLILRIVLAGPGRAAGLGLLAVQLASLLPIAIGANPVIDTRLFYPPPPPSVRHLQAAGAHDPGRVHLGEAKNVGMLYGLAEVAAYDGLTPRWIAELASPTEAGLLASGALNLTAGVGTPAADLLGLRRVVLGPGRPAPAPHFTLEYDGPDARVFRNERALPRAWLVGSARCAGDAEARAQIASGALDPRVEAVLDGCPASLPPATRPAAARADVVGWTPGQVRVRTETDAGAYLVVADAWFPGWRAWVDGREATVLRADTVFKAVRVESGRHEVRVEYRPPWFTAGLALSAVAALVAVACLAGGRLRRRLGRAGLVAGLLGAGVWGTAEALPAAPFEVTVAPATFVDGETASLRLEGRDAGADAARPFDLYVVQIPSGPAVIRYLSPTGGWSTTPAAYLGGVSAAGVAPAVVSWRAGGPPGWVSLVLVFAGPSAPPRDRARWVYQPIMARVRVRATPAPWTAGLPWLAPLALAALAAAAVVTRYSSRPRDRAPSD